MKKCKSCKVEIPNDAKKCSHCQTDQRGWIRRHPIWTTIIVLISFFTLIGMFGSGSNESSNSSNTKPSSVPTKKQIGIKTKQKRTMSTPVPTDPCADSAGTSDWTECEKENNPPAKLNATVQASDQNLSVTNNDNVNWNTCDYTIDQDTDPDDYYELGSLFGTNYSSIPAHQTVYIPWGQITKQNGTRFSYDTTEPNDLTIDCTVGSNIKTSKSAEWSNY